MPISKTTSQTRAQQADASPDQTTTPLAGQPMPYACQTCVKRKVGCDKVYPICGRCSKSHLDCTYQAPQPRGRKRKPSGDVNDRLALYENILLQHGLLPMLEEPRSEGDQGVAPSTDADAPLSLRFHRSETAPSGRIVANHGRTRYVDNSMWGDLGEDEMRYLADEVDNEAAAAELSTQVSLDPLTASFLGTSQNLSMYHPQYREAIYLWQTHLERVEPTCRILHGPSARKLVDRVARDPHLATNAEVALVFAIYYFAAFTLTDGECLANLRVHRATLLENFVHATRQALANANFLKSTETIVLQAYMLHLLACRFAYDPHTYWLLTGTCLRIAQRLGLHRDGSEMGLPPFETLMRRRIWFQVIPLDGIACRLAGVGISLAPETWNTQSPLNLNEDQLWPGMPDIPQEAKGATDMIYCLTRSTIGLIVTKGLPSMQNFESIAAADALIKSAEKQVEEKYIRYCDITNPVHFLAIGFARCAISAFRLHIRMPKVRNKTATPAERRDIMQLTYKILDTDIAVHQQPNVKKFLWLARSFYGWGSWDSMIFTLSTLERADLLTVHETCESWRRIETIFANHDEIISNRRALHIAVGRLVLKAWASNPPVGVSHEPEFISRLRQYTGMQPVSRQDSMAAAASGTHTPAGGQGRFNVIGTESLAPPANMTGPARVGVDNGDNEYSFNFDLNDWEYWGQMIKEHESRHG